MLPGVVELLEIAKYGSGLRVFLIEFRYERPGTRGRRPNERLKLVGGDRFKGSRVLYAGAHELSFNNRCAGGRVARSLSAIRLAAPALTEAFLGPSHGCSDRG